ncbi:MAG: TRAP transporter small permease [Rhizobiaceae bacterium]
MTPGILARVAVKGEYFVLEATLVLLVLVNATNVCARYVFGRSIGPLFEIMLLVSVAIYWLGAATAQRTESHLGMSYIVGRLPSSIARAAGLLRGFISVAFLLIVAYSGAALAMSQFRNGAISGSINMPLWVFTAFIPIGALLMAWRIVFPSRPRERAK